MGNAQNQTPQAEPGSRGADVSVLERLQRHKRQMAPHHLHREQGRLICDAIDRIYFLEQEIRIISVWASVGAQSSEPVSELMDIANRATEAVQNDKVSE